MPAPAKRKSRFWRKCRIYFRRARITVWLVILAALGALIYLNLVGLPDFVKRPIITRLRERGVALDFSELRLHWSRGFVASQVRFGSVESPAVPRFTADEVEIDLYMRALLGGKIRVDSMTLRDGKLEWTLTKTNEPDRILKIENIGSSLRLMADDSWVLEDLHGEIAGANFFLSGSLLNASSLKDWKFGAADSPKEATRWPDRLRQIAETLDQITFSSPPELRLDLNGDARDPRSLDARFTFRAQEADTAWGRATQVLLKLRISPAATNELSRAEISLLAQNVETRWATTTNLEVKLRLITAVQAPELVDASGTIRIDGAETPWGSLGGAQMKTIWVHGLTNPIPRSARVELHMDYLTTWMTRASQIDLSATLESTTNHIAPDEGLSFWNKLLPYAVHWNVSVEALRALALKAENISFEGDWRAPELNILAMKANLYRGSVDARAKLDVVTRDTAFEAASDFDLQRLAPFLTEKSNEWLAKFSWSEPPKIRAAVAMVLPLWTKTDVNWLTALRPSLKLAGQIAVTNGGYQGIHVDWVTSRFSYTNMTWWLPDFAVGRPEGGVRLNHYGNEVTGDYYFQLHSSIDPKVVLPLLGDEVKKGFDLCEFGAPPVIEGELQGNWRHPESVGFRGRVALTNFSFRGKSTDAIVSGLNYTNLVVDCIEPRIWSGTQHLAAAGIAADFHTMRTYFTNGFSTLDPAMVVQAIGPVVAQVMEPYHFGQPPVVRFWGYTSMNDPHDADVVFEGAGKDFRSLNFRVPEYTARVHWNNEFLVVTNASGKFYDGRAKGWARFVFNDGPGATYMFTLDAVDANLHRLVADITERDNALDGLLTGLLVVTNATTDNIRTWDGYGHANLREGLLWELPIFGVLSNPLDAIIPGVGNSRFSEGSANYSIEKGVIQSNDLEMRSSAMRLKYRGTVNFDGDIRARVIAEPLRDMPVVGSVVSTLLSPVAKLFTYKIRGTMSEPKIETVYIPGFLMVPFSPFQSIGKLFSSEPTKANASTNAPMEIK